MTGGAFAEQAQPVACADAPLAHADPTRAFALGDDARSVFPGVTRVEARDVVTQLAGVDDELRDLLVAVTLPVLVTGGAGPHLIDLEGRLVLPLADHPLLGGTRVAIGPLGSGRDQIGLVEGLTPAGRLWRWRARAAVAEDARVAALDRLHAVADRSELERWCRGYGSIGG